MADLLELEGLSAGYGEAVVLSDIALKLEEGHALALLGRNGTGKTTLINTIVGLTRRRAGAIRLGGTDITRLRPDQRALAGIGWVPQERNIFRSLTVDENITAVATKGPWTLERIYAMFPGDGFVGEEGEGAVSGAAEGGGVVGGGGEGLHQHRRLPPPVCVGEGLGYALGEGTLIDNQRLG